MDSGGRDIKAALARGAIIGDGATGTQLQAAGLSPGDCAEEWNETHPDAVRMVYASYADAGSQVVTSNTFGGSPAKLAARGLDARCEELNALGVRRAREAVPAGAFVAADVGPSGLILEPYGETPVAEAKAGFARQIRGLVEGGPDCILIETMMDLAEALAAVEAAREVAAHLPVFCTMSFQVGGRTTFGVDVPTAAEALSGAGVDGLGLNCGLGSGEAIAMVESLVAATDLPVIVQPNAGMPRLENGETVFDETPEEMAGNARRFRELGARWLGACCGSTPDHIRAMAQVVVA
ncbi:MAG: homocysteine methyltransferase [Armatimonadia bacterium]|nr:homocysteine methyltransferase [Armatimonadia bacterium]